MDAMKRRRRSMDQKLQKLERESRRLDAKLRLLSGAGSPARDRDAEPPRMLQPGARGEVTTLRGGLVGDNTLSPGGSGPMLPHEDRGGGSRRGPAPWASYGVLDYGTARPLRLQRGPVSMLSRRHDRPTLRDHRSERVMRNRLLFYLLLCAIAAMLMYRFWLS